MTYSAAKLKSRCDICYISEVIEQSVLYLLSSLIDCCAKAKIFFCVDSYDIVACRPFAKQ
jgi:hypothetical protein